ncbi:MAG: hypothetical protein JRN33_04535 [Nitrososphaerota archaeon]|nr:hypothetical protein [Nitrososphaerota archaeon]MDG6954232.1 hypothetical protein [Nitrososphaerota archaeon]
MQAQEEGAVRLACRVTGEPFYPLRKGGEVLCSQCGQVFCCPREEAAGGAAEAQGPSTA